MCGVAMEVPEIIPVLPLFQVLIISTPGANTSMTDPQLEKEARESSASVAPTVQTLGSEAGEDKDASTPSFPAATARNRPASTAAAAAVFTAEDSRRRAPSEILATAFPIPVIFV